MLRQHERDAVKKETRQGATHFVQKSGVQKIQARFRSRTRDRLRWFNRLRGFRGRSQQPASHVVRIVPPGGLSTGWSTAYISQEFPRVLPIAAQTGQLGYLWGLRGDPF